MREVPLQGMGSRASVLVSTKGPLWGYPRCGLGAVGAVLEPFCGHLSPKIDKVYETLTFEIPPRRALGGTWFQSAE